MMCTSRSLQRGEHFNGRAILAHPPHTLGSAHVGHTGQDLSVAIRQSARHCPTAHAEYPTVLSPGETHKHKHKPGSARLTLQQFDARSCTCNELASATWACEHPRAHRRAGAACPPALRCVHHLSDEAHRRSASFRDRCKLVRNTPRNDESEYSYLNVDQARACLRRAQSKCMHTPV